MQFKGILSALDAAFFFGLGPTFAKLSYGLGANPALAIILRYALAVFIIINLYKTIDLQNISEIE